MKNTLHHSLAPLALVAALTLSACSGEEASFEDTATQPTTGSEDVVAEEAITEDGEATTEDDVTAQSAAAAGVDLTDLGEPVGTATIPAIVDADPDATMDITLHELRRAGDTVVGTYSFLVDSEDETPQRLYDYLGLQQWSPFLVDTVNLNRHDVLGPFTESRVMTQSTGSKFRPGQTFYAMAVFAAPPAEVTTMTAQLVDGAPAVTEVPIR